MAPPATRGAGEGKPVIRTVAWLLVKIGLLVAVGFPILAAEGQPGTTVIENGTSHEGTSSRKYEVNVIERVIPGGAMINDFTQFGEATSDVTTVTTYYYAGIDGRTLHIYMITRQGSRRTETERMPILLPLGNDDTAVFPIRTFSRRTPFTLRLKKNPDNSVTVTVVK